MKLYTNPLSGYCHRVELLLSLLSLPCDHIRVDLSPSAPRPKEFLAANPWGQVPVLVDGEAAICESTAILVYLASKTGSRQWLPVTPLQAALVQAWLSRAAGQGVAGLSRARMIRRFGAMDNLATAQRDALRLLTHMDRELTASSFLAGDAPTLADIALYAYVAAAPEGGIDLTPFGAVGRWLHAIEKLPRFVPFGRHRPSCGRLLPGT